MNHESAVLFDATSRIHLGLSGKNLERSVAFYRTLFGQEPTKTRPHYAEFEVADPPVKLSLKEVGGEIRPSNPVANIGIQVKSTETVRAIADRLTEVGLKTRIEENATCCHPVQNKVCATDPDGTQWEVYVGLDNGGSDPTQCDCCRASLCGCCS